MEYAQPSNSCKCLKNVDTHNAKKNDSPTVLPTNIHQMISLQPPKQNPSTKSNVNNDNSCNTSIQKHNHPTSIGTNMFNISSPKDKAIVNSPDMLRTNVQLTISLQPPKQNPSTKSNINNEHSYGTCIQKVIITLLFVPACPTCLHKIQQLTMT